MNTVTPATEFANVYLHEGYLCFHGNTIACAVWRVILKACAFGGAPQLQAEVRTGCRHATDPPTIHSNDNTSNDNVVVLHVLRMDSYKFPPVSYSVAVTRGGEAKQ